MGGCLEDWDVCGAWEGLGVGNCAGCLSGLFAGGLLTQSRAEQSSLPGSGTPSAPSTVM